MLPCQLRFSTGGSGTQLRQVRRQLGAASDPGSSRPVQSVSKLSTRAGHKVCDSRRCLWARVLKSVRNHPSGPSTELGSPVSGRQAALSNGRLLLITTPQVTRAFSRASRRDTQLVQIVTLPGVPILAVGDVALRNCMTALLEKPRSGVVR